MTTTAHPYIANLRRTELLHRYGIWPDEHADRSLAGRKHLVMRLEYILRGMKDAEIRGHFAYSAPDHRGLLRVLHEERAELLADA